MTATTRWVTVAAYDTEFLARLVVDHLEDAGIPTRVLSDSGGGSLPHISFGTGGYRVQVPADSSDAAREHLASLPEDGVGDLDVGTVIEGDVASTVEGDDTFPRRIAERPGIPPQRSGAPGTPRIAGIVMLVVGILLIVWGVLLLANPMG